jgi:hypothetical protein
LESMPLLQVCMLLYLNFYVTMTTCGNITNIWKNDCWRPDCSEIPRAESCKAWEGIDLFNTFIFQSYKEYAWVKDVMFSYTSLVPLVHETRSEKIISGDKDCIDIFLFVKSNCVVVSGWKYNEQKFINLLVNIYLFNCRVVRICVDL